MSDHVIVDTAAGPVTGLRRADTHWFGGLRYAEPPVGDLRFRPPQAVASTGRSIDGTVAGGRCHQAGAGADVIFPDLDVPGDLGEDCLVLDVYTPAGGGVDRPVVVWIHGGAFINGSANEYDATQLVTDHDVIVVTISYRLGIFGFLDLSQLGPEFAGSANLGIQDQIAALRWVNQHIAAFGGDPANVTLWGESAGGTSVLALLGAPAARGLFRRVAAFSGAETLAPPMDQLAAIAGHLGAATADECLSTLMAMTSDELSRLQWASGFYAGTTLDGTVLTRPACEAVIDGGAAHVPVVTGTCRDEGAFLTPHFATGDQVTMAVLFGLSASTGRDDGSAYRAWLDDTIGLSDPVRCMERAWFDLFRASALRVAAAATAHGAGGWVYDFEVDTDHPLGVTHFADVPFTFNWIRHGHPREFVHPSTEENRELADRWSSTLIEFARSGWPNGHGLPNWPPYDADRYPSMRITHDPVIVDDVDGEMRSIYRVGDNSI